MVSPLEIMVLDGRLILNNFLRIPYGIVVVTDFSDGYPMSVHAFTTFMAHFCSALNPVCIFFAKSNYFFHVKKY
jgi:hypothetical protein